MDTTETQAAPAGGPVEAPSLTVARNAFYLVVGQALTTALAIVLSAVLGRSLGAEGYGKYFIITTIATFAYVFVEWGQPLLLIRSIATQPLRSGELLGTALALRTAFCAAVMVPAGLAAWALGYGALTTWLCLFLILAMLPFFLAQGFGMVFRGQDRMGKDATVSVLNKALVLLVTVPALLLGAGLPGVILAQAVAGVAAVALALALYRRMKAPRLHLSFAAAREILKGGIPILAMTAAISAKPYLDVVILSKLAPANAVGWFGAARNILGTLMAPATILGAAAYPRLSRASEGPLVDLRREAGAAMRTMIWLGALAGTGTYLFAHAAVRLIYGSKGFEPAATILEVFAPGLFLLFTDILLGNVVYACGGAKGFAIAKIVSVVVSTSLDALLIPIFQARTGNGGIAVVIAFAASEAAVFVGGLMVLRRGVLSLAALLDAGRALASVAGTLLVFRVMPPLPLLLGMVLCVAVFTVVSFALGLVRREDVSMLRSLFRLPRSGGTTAS
jgi:O-antigen/teichoic acid export membrane protein